MDVIALFQHGITYAVATLGTATSPHHIQRLLRYTPEIVFCFDGDEAGRTAAWRALQVMLPLMQDSLQIRFLFLPDGEDPDSLVRKEGKEAFEKRLESALSLSGFFFQTLSQQSDMNTLEGRARFAAAAINHIKQLPAGLYAGMLVEELSKRARVDLQDLKKQVGQTGTTTAATITPIAPLPEIKTKLAGPIRLALSLLIQHPTLVTALPTPLPECDLPGYPFFLQLIEIIKNKPSITTGGLLEHWRDQREESFIAKLAQWEHTVPETGVKDEFLGAIRQLTLLSLESDIGRFLAKAAQQDLSDEEKKELTQLITKKQPSSNQ